MGIPTALVTGAGAGTGREFVKLLLDDGAKVLAVSLLKDELDDLVAELGAGDDRLVIHQADLSEPDAAEALVAWCEENGHVVDILINNAGFAVYGLPTEVDLDRVQTMIGLNVTTCMKLSIAFARQMRDRGRGRILVMGSTAGMAPTPRLGAYCATKAFTNSFHWSLGSELRGTGVTLTVVTPGGFQSKFASTAGVSGPALLTKVYEKEKLDARGVAVKAYAAMKKGRPTVTVGAAGHVAKGMGRVFSPPFMARLFKSM
ncbi:SDR family NAD(P)-dependent oxidoreductase [Sporichthya polymorpha]|uniref:SDR family NAD(P)-dependent oxidoreductase n=1 Tax=Sporichthya polymorpha TaxID=35751 RepID=UPI0003709F80|nr:SDR family NAD(P)-dependent oxidoreductase [Sporichthya polymorpha]